MKGGEITGSVDIKRKKRGSVATLDDTLDHQGRQRRGEIARSEDEGPRIDRSEQFEENFGKPAGELEPSRDVFIGTRFADCFEHEKPPMECCAKRETVGPLGWDC